MRNKIEVTDFLTEVDEAMLQEMLVQNKEENYFFEGAYPEAERKMLFFYPDKMTKEIVPKNNYIAVIRIELPKEQQGEYAHRHYYSAVLKLGIRREKMGDILVEENGADIIISKEIAEYTKQGLEQLTRFHKAAISLVPVEEIRLVEPKKEKLEIMIPSFRMDVIVSELGKVGRTKAVEWMKEGLVLRNNKPEDKIDRMVKQGDSITIRRKGKFQIGEVKGTTKKGKILLEVWHNI